MNHFTDHSCVFASARRQLKCRHRHIPTPNGNDNEVTNHLCLCRRCSNFKQVCERETVWQTKFHIQSVRFRKNCFLSWNFCRWRPTPISSVCFTLFTHTYQTSHSDWTSQPKRVRKQGEKNMIFCSFDSQMMFDKWNVCWVRGLSAFAICCEIYKFCHALVYSWTDCVCGLWVDKTLRALDKPELKLSGNEISTPNQFTIFYFSFLALHSGQSSISREDPHVLRRMSSRAEVVYANDMEPHKHTHNL